MSLSADAPTTDFSPIDAGQTNNSNELDVTTWLNRITKAKNKEEQWRQRAKRIVRIYRDDSETEGTTYTSNRPFSYSESPYNILWANIQTLTPALFSSMPRPDVRSRENANDPNAKSAGEILEKVLAYEMDRGKFDRVMDRVVFDYLAPGRGTMRVRTKPEIDKKHIEEELPGGEIQIEIQEELVSQMVFTEIVPWTKLILDPVERWEDVMWMAFQHDLTEDEFEEFFPDEKGKVAVVTHNDNKFSVEPRYEVYEIWDKRAKKVYYMGSAPKLLKMQDDPFGFEHFWPIYEPLVSIKTNDTMVPVPEFTIYEPQAYELNAVTYRITDLVKAAKFHGIYDSSQNNMEDLLQSADSTFIPDNGDNMKKNGIKSIIDTVDISPCADVLKVLYQQRDEVKEIIYEITGISDIRRGEGNAHETATAQSLKAQYSSLRLENRRKSITEFIVGNLRMMAEMICKFYPAEQLAKISGMEITPEIEMILRDDIVRNYKIDIETDSAILARHEDDTAKRAQLIQGIGDFFQMFTPLVQSGAIPLETAKALLTYGLGATKLPRSVTDALDLIGKQPNMPQGMPGEMQGQLPGMDQQMPQDIPLPMEGMLAPPEMTEQFQDFNP
jgi:hypothetical protein